MSVCRSSETAWTSSNSSSISCPHGSYGLHSCACRVTSNPLPLPHPSSTNICPSQTSAASQPVWMPKLIYLPKYTEMIWVPSFSSQKWSEWWSLDSPGFGIVKDEHNETATSNLVYLFDLKHLQICLNVFFMNTNRVSPRSLVFTVSKVPCETFLPSLGELYLDFYRFSTEVICEIKTNPSLNAAQRAIKRSTDVLCNCVNCIENSTL